MDKHTSARLARTIDQWPYEAVSLQADLCPGCWLCSVQQLLESIRYWCWLGRKLHFVPSIWSHDPDPAGLVNHWTHRRIGPSAHLNQSFSSFTFGTCYTPSFPPNSAFNNIISEINDHDSHYRSTTSRLYVETLFHLDEYKGRLLPTCCWERECTWAWRAEANRAHVSKRAHAHAPKRRWTKGRCSQIEAEDPTKAQRLWPELWGVMVM